MSCSVTADRPKMSPILITHYINPSLFWFKKQSVDCQTFFTYESDLQKFAELSAANVAMHRAAVGEIVLVKSLSQKKWVRCRVENITQFSGVLEYTVWLIDYGYVVT